MSKCQQKNLYPLISARNSIKKLSELGSGISDLEFYEFQYALENIQPLNGGWSTIIIPKTSDIENKIQLRPEENCKITIDESIMDLNRSLFAGIVNNSYNLHWIDKYFYFDVRGFLFLPQTIYFTESILNHLQNKPFLKFKKRQSKGEYLPDQNKLH